MSEKYNNVVNVERITPKTLGNILDFVYTGVVKITDDDVLDLLDGAEFTRIPKIKLKCSDHLAQNANAGNCLKLRSYAKRYNLESLEKVSQRVLAENLVYVLKQNDFRELTVEEVSFIVGIKKNRATEEAAFSGIVRWVKHNTKERQRLFVNLFSLINLSTVSESFLNQNIKLEPLVFNTLKCTQRLLSSFSGMKLKKISELSIIVIGWENSAQKCWSMKFNPDELENLPMLNIGRCGAAICKTGDNLYLMGGGEKMIGGEAYKSVEVFNLQCRTAWNTVANLLEARKDAACAVLDGKIYVSGGWRGNFLSSCEKYDRISNQWFKTSSMFHARAYHAMAVLDGSLYCVGGCKRGNCLSSAECYDQVANVWTEISPMLFGRQRLALVALNGQLYAIGGFNGSAMATVEKYNPKSLKWSNVKSLNVARSRHDATVLQGRIYVFGGSDDSRLVMPIEVYNPQDDTWTICFKMKSIPKTSAVIAV